MCVRAERRTGAGPPRGLLHIQRMPAGREAAASLRPACCSVPSARTGELSEQPARHDLAPRWPPRGPCTGRRQPPLQGLLRLFRETRPWRDLGAKGKPGLGPHGRAGLAGVGGICGPQVTLRSARDTLPDPGAAALTMGFRLPTGSWDAEGGAVLAPLTLGWKWR